MPSPDIGTRRAAAMSSTTRRMGGLRRLGACGGMEDDAATARIGGQFDRDIRLAETIDDALGPGDIHPAGQVAMVLDEGVVRAIPEADASS